MDVLELLHMFLLNFYITFTYAQGQNEGFPGSSVVSNPPTIAGDAGSIPGLGICPGEGTGTPLQYSCLKNPMDRGAWQATGHEAAKSWT